MNGHLTSQQIIEWVAGERTPEAQRHVAGCEACRSECEAFSGTLTAFRDSVREWSEARQPVRFETRKNSVWRHSWQISLATLAVAACMVLAVLLPSRQDPKPSITTATVTDAALLKQIDTEVSQTAPESMQPLMNLVTWDGKKDLQ